MSKISQKYVRSVMREYAGKIPICKDVIIEIQEYLDDECHRICEAGTKEYLAEVELRKIQKIRPRHRISKDNIKEVNQ